MTAFDTLRRVCRDAAAGGVTPGLVVVVGAGGKTIFHEAFGDRQTDPVTLPATPDTVYDLASLTKALVTSALTMQAVAENRLHLDENLLAEGGAPGATIRLTLAHAGGFAAHRRFYERAELAGLSPVEARAQVIAMAAAEPPEYVPGSRSLYSDLGFILLGDRLERAFGSRLDQLADERLFRPLGLGALGFVSLPRAEHPERESQTAVGVLAGRPVAAGQRCPVRAGMVVGEVDDLNAHAMGGVAGHAGLFGTAADVARLTHALCAAWRGTGPEGGAPVVPAEVLRAFWAPAGIPGSTWRLGWDGPAARGSIAGELLSRRAVGHLAFTGCSLWIDPERETFVVVLANRIHPVARDDRRFRELRPVLNDAALAGAGYPPAAG